jgi:hypothetical protein
MKKRILLLATVAALMAVMLVVSAAPGLAHNVICPGNGKWFQQTVAWGTPADEDGDLLVCVKEGPHGTSVKDDHGWGGH